MSAGARHTLGLPIAVGAFMLGIVFAANHERFGAPAASIGLLAALAAGALAVRLFRSGRPRPATETADNPEGSVDG